MNNPVMVLGAGSLGAMALDIFQRNKVVVYGFLDDNKALHGQSIGDVTVLGDTDDEGFLKLIGHKCEAFVAIGDGRVRKKLVKMLNDIRKTQPVNAVHDTAVLSTLAGIGHGNLIGPLAVVNAFAGIGQHCLILTGALIDSHALIGDYVQVGVGSVVNSGVTVEEGAFVGTGAVIVPGITVGKNARIGAGSVVVENVDAGVTVFGNPAKKVG